MKAQRALYLFSAFATVPILLPIGWFLSFIREVTSFCGSSTETIWRIIAGLCILGLVLYLVIIGIVLWANTLIEENL